MNTENTDTGSTNRHESLGQKIQDFVKKRLYILDNAEPEKTIEGIKKDIDFSGFNLWILIPAILLASTGLNANSAAVVIGAMLISPLMGPIMGIGLSVGINDSNTLKRSLRNLGIMITVSLITSTLFFLIIPISDASSEILARIKPDLRDVFIAFFGGFAGILAGNRREKNNVIPGVAIATALMPPLCTAGYGLATLQFHYFLGAAYLFLINTFFIALATVLVVRYLRFPVATFVNPSKARRSRQLIGLAVIVMILPASYIFYTVVKEGIYKRKVDNFIATTTNYEGTEIVKKEIVVTDSISSITLVMFGEKIPAEVIAAWQKELSITVENTKLRIFQGSDAEPLAEANEMIDLYTRAHSDALSKQQVINELELKLQAYESDALPNSLFKEIKINYPEIVSVKMGKMLFSELDSNQIINEANFYVQFDSSKKTVEKETRLGQLEKWLTSRLGIEYISVSEFYPKPREADPPKKNTQNP